MEWPLLWPEDSDKKLAAHTMELLEYVDRPVALKACPCPLAAIHMHQGMDLFETKHSTHPFIQPIEVLAYGFNTYGFLKEKNHLL
ncbi:hypothetical protein DAPPUDRAFT_260885 [Daphnia pulex]|uniref:Uncharacterized protein n=1 Tax=Daphnia pulex TaxID=6669 RepID=E9HK13_DAPPU|nr:hypothetical protein DAPPUDRAFT_260885 [Daphnia pulex]|eukprot:EFX67910.1 hypothetical protein DAPPUDRAFT_260885 [Daphnia pulex]